MFISVDVNTADRVKCIENALVSMRVIIPSNQIINVIIIMANDDNHHPK
jgi:hypothetical protein